MHLDLIMLMGEENKKTHGRYRELKNIGVEDEALRSWHRRCIESEEWDSIRRTF